MVTPTELALTLVETHPHGHGHGSLGSDRQRGHGRLTQRPKAAKTNLTAIRLVHSQPLHPILFHPFGPLLRGFGRAAGEDGQG